LRRCTPTQSQREGEGDCEAIRISGEAQILEREYFIAIIVELGHALELAIECIEAAKQAENGHHYRKLIRTEDLIQTDETAVGSPTAKTCGIQSPPYQKGMH
jgi:hypothetical protein